MASKRDECQRLVDEWNRSASDLEHADRNKSNDYTAIERRILRVQANVYRACAGQLSRVPEVANGR